MPIFVTSWVANCNWCHAEIHSLEGVVSEAAFQRMIEGDGWIVDINANTVTCPSCVKQGRS